MISKHLQTNNFNKSSMTVISITQLEIYWVHHYCKITQIYNFLNSTSIRTNKFNYAGLTVVF